MEAIASARGRRAAAAPAWLYRALDKSLSVMLSADKGAALKNHTTATSRVCVSVGRFRIEGTRDSRASRRVAICSLFVWSTDVLERPRVSI